ncbi:transcription elongation factor spt5 [Pleosporales sp. CAS-2024a]
MLIGKGSRCVQNKEAHLCTTTWKEGYNPSVHRRYPRKPSVPVSGSSDTSSTLLDSPSDAQDHPRTVATDNDDAAAARSSDALAGPPMAIGRSRCLDITINTLLNEKDSASSDPNFLNPAFKDTRSGGKMVHYANRGMNFCSSSARSTEMQYINALLPSKEAVLTITDYYHNNMLYWTGGVYHSPSFKKTLIDAYGSSDTIDLQTLDWRWTALLFAILASSMIASPEALSSTWGYSVDDKIRCAREWGAACLSSLNLGKYMSQYHINSVQAVYVLHTYEHLQGSSHQWAALRSISLTIAKGLGLNKLGPHADDDKVMELTGDERQAFIDREIGRRMWYTMVTQEWRQFSTILPKLVDEVSMMDIGEDVPSFPLFGRYLYECASLLLDYQNAVMDADEADEAARYALTLRYEGELRAISAEKVPKALSHRTPLDAAWPKWVKWARTLHQASANHKIIMIHQSFISKSFKDARYTYTRWACSTAAKNIVGLYETRGADEPQWWVEQAFLITAALCLLLDLFNRPDGDAEAEDHLVCVYKAVPWTNDEAALFNFDIDNLVFEDLMDYLPAEGGLDNQVLFDHVFELVNGQT